MRIAIIDDYQGVALECADWSRIRQANDVKGRGNIRLLRDGLQIHFDIYNKCVDTVDGRRLREKKHIEVWFRSKQILAYSMPNLKVGRSRIDQ